MQARSTVLPLATFAIAIGLGLFTNLSTADQENDGPDAEPDWDKRVGPYRMAISTDKTTYAPCEPIQMRIEMKNISASDARYGTGRLAPIAWDYQFSVTDAKGHELPMTRYGQYLMDRSGDIFSDPKKTITIKPGESVVREVCINRIRDMTMEGKYKIVVRTSVPYGESVPFDLASAPLEIEVKEPEARDKAADADAKAEKAEPAEE